MSGNKKNKKPVFLFLLFFFLPVVFAAASSVNRINGILLYFPLLLAAMLLGARIFTSKRPALTVALWIAMALSFVAATGWFFSPFFFLLYLAALALGFIFTPGVAISFTISLVTLFSFSLTGEQPAHDFLILLSLLLVIPLTLWLRRSYLVVEQDKKDIMILEPEKSADGITSLEHILKNQINKIGVTLRQPITYIKQGLIMINSGKLTNEEAAEILQRMEKSSEELSTLVKQFERESTRHDFLKINKDKKI